MTNDEQEKLFKRIREKFSLWNSSRASGYLAGILDEARRPKPPSIVVSDAVAEDDYAAGYCCGFADARGVDALVADWAKILGITERILDFCWWVD